MGFDPLSAIADLAKTIVQRVVKDPEAAQAAALEVDRMAQTGALAELDAYKAITLGQLDVNKIEAGSSDTYTSRARPTVVYAGAAALVYGFILQPFLVWAWPSHPLPAIDLGVFKDLLFGVLGIYTVGRSAEQVASIVKTGSKT